MTLLVKVAIPYGGTCEFRARNLKHVTAWIDAHHGYDISVGTSDRTPFSPAQARNNAARTAGEWDVLLHWDGDTIAHPDAIREAAELAATSNKLVFAANAHTYCDELSTQRFIDTGLWFPAPTDWPDTRTQYRAAGSSKQFDPKSIYRDPSGGILAVSRELWDATGGYCDSLGGDDSYEDLVFFAQAQIFAAGITRVAGMQLHLWHPPAPRVRGANHHHYHQLVRIMARPNAKKCARDYLAQLGHTVP